MSNTISRRAVLAGAPAVAVVAAMPAIPALSGVEQDPALSAIAEWHEAYAAFDAAWDALEAARERVRNMPRWALISGKTEAGGQFCWGRDEIEAAAEDDDRSPYRLTPAERDRYLAELDEKEREGRQRCKELGVDKFVDAEAKARDHMWESLERVELSPATTVAGLLAKVLVLCERSYDNGDPQNDLIRSVRADVERLDGGAS